MVDERGRARAFSRGARGGTPRKKETEAEGAACGAVQVAARRRTHDQWLRMTYLATLHVPSSDRRSGRRSSRDRLSSVRRPPEHPVLVRRVSEHRDIGLRVLERQPPDGVGAERLLHGDDGLRLATVEVRRRRRQYAPGIALASSDPYRCHCPGPRHDYSFRQSAGDEYRCRMAVSRFLHHLGQRCHHLHGCAQDIGELDLLDRHRRLVHPSLRRPRSVSYTRRCSPPTWSSPCSAIWAGGAALPSKQPHEFQAGPRSYGACPTSNRAIVDSARAIHR